MKLFLDQDGVLADFDKKKFEIFGSRNVPDGIMWHVINKYFPEFFFELSPMKDMKQLWDYCKQFNPTILTAIPKVNINKIDEQKRRWTDMYLNAMVPMIFCRRADKQYFCTNFDCVLVDDHPKNCKEWKDKGGVSIFHRNAEETINRLKMLHGL